MDSKLRITIATGIYPPDIGGPATFAVAVERAWQDAGHDVRVLSFTRFRALPTGIRHLLYMFHLFRIAKGSHVILALDPVSVGLPTRAVSRMRGIPFMLRLVGDYAWEQYVQRNPYVSLEDFQHMSLPRKYARLRRIERSVAHEARSVIVPSHYLAGIAREWGISETKIHVVYNSITPAHEPKHTYEASSPFQFMTAGRLVPWKGFRMAIEALAKRDNAELTIIGGGPDARTLKKTVSEHKLELRVHFVPQLSREHFREALSSYDAFLLPTRYEGFSHALVEAMSTGLPIITTHAGGNNEVVRHGENALVCGEDDVVAWASAMEQVESDQALRERLGKHAHTDAARFYGDDMSERYLQLILNIL